jgi:hypothetical protein
VCLLCQVSLPPCTHNSAGASLALGLLDCAIVNAYIVHREVYKRAEKKPLSHAEFLTTLQNQLVEVEPSDLVEEVWFYLFCSAFHVELTSDGNSLPVV